MLRAGRNVAVKAQLSLGVVIIVLLCSLHAAAEPVAGDAVPEKAADTGRVTIVEQPVPGFVEEDADAVDAPASRLNRSLDASHLYVSRSVDQLALWIDRFLGGQSIDYAANETVARLRYSNYWEERDGNSDTVRFRLRLNLPKTEERLNLIVSSDLDEDEVLAEDGIREGRDDDSASGEVALHFEAVERSAFKLRYRLGLKSGGRLRTGLTASYKKRFFDNYFLQVREELYWLDRFGFGTRLSIELDRRITDTRNLRLDSRFDFNEDVEGVAWSPRLSVNRALSNSRVISSYILAYGETRPDHYVGAYGPGLLYRQTLGRPWFFVELEPRWLFKRDDFAASRKKTASIALRFELVFDEESSLYWH